MKTPRVGVEHQLQLIQNYYGSTERFSSLPDSDATVSSENSEGEILGERERDAAKKYAGYLNNS